MSQQNQTSEATHSQSVTTSQFRVVPKSDYLCGTRRSHTEIDSVAYDTAGRPLRGFTVRGSYLKNSQQALIEIFKDGKVVRSFEYPAYRIWNIPAHFDEYIDGLDADGKPEAVPDEPRAVQTQICPVCRTVHDLPLCPRPAEA